MADPTSRAERVEAYVQRISHGPDFPALADRIRDVVQILSGEDMTMQRLANMILKDYSLTTKVLRTANSFHYNRIRHSRCPPFQFTECDVSKPGVSPDTAQRAPGRNPARSTKN